MLIIRWIPEFPSLDAKLYLADSAMSVSHDTNAMLEGMSFISRNMGTPKFFAIEIFSCEC